MNLCFSVRLRISTGTSSSERDSYVMLPSSLLTTRPLRPVICRRGKITARPATSTTSKTENEEKRTRCKYLRNVFRPSQLIDEFVQGVGGKVLGQLLQLIQQIPFHLLGNLHRVLTGDAAVLTLCFDWRGERTWTLNHTVGGLSVRLCRAALCSPMLGAAGGLTGALKAGLVEPSPDASKALWMESGSMLFRRFFFFFFSLPFFGSFLMSHGSIGGGSAFGFVLFLLWSIFLFFLKAQLEISPSSPSSSDSSLNGLKSSSSSAELTDLKLSSLSQSLPESLSDSSDWLSSELVPDKPPCLRGFFLCCFFDSGPKRCRSQHGQLKHPWGKREFVKFHVMIYRFHTRAEPSHTFPFLALLFRLCCSVSRSRSLLWRQVNTQQAVKLLPVRSGEVLLNQGLQHSSAKREKRVTAMRHRGVGGWLPLPERTLQWTRSHWAPLRPPPEPPAFWLLRWTADRSPRTAEQTDSVTISVKRASAVLGAK